MKLFRNYISKQTSETQLSKYKRMIVTILCFAVILVFQIIDKSVNIYTMMIVALMIIYIRNDIEKMLIIEKVRLEN